MHAELKRKASSEYVSGIFFLKKVTYQVKLRLRIKGKNLPFGVINSRHRAKASANPKHVKMVLDGQIR